MYAIPMSHIFSAITLLVFVTSSYQNEGNRDTDRSHSECHYDIDIIWTKDIGTSAFASTPLIADINGDGLQDIVAAIFTEDITVVEGATGQALSGTSWPFSLQDSSFHASPLQYDYNRDGVMDICLCTSNGEIVFLDNNGDFMYGETLKIPNLAVKRLWYHERSAYYFDQIQDVILKNFRPDPPYPGSQTNLQEDPLWSRYHGDCRSGLLSDGQHVSIDSHILSTPVIADLNNDGRIEEFIVAVSYYFDTEYYSTPENLQKLRLPQEELENYVASSLVVLNLTSKAIVRQIPLDLSKGGSDFPAYALFSPTVVDLDSNSGPLEILLGTSSGHLYAFNSDGSLRNGFPVVVGPIHGQVAVEDLDKDGQLEIILTDTSVNIVCLNAHGKVLWDRSLSGSSSAGSRIADINADGVLDIVIATNNGYIWALTGTNGDVLPGWPKKLPTKIVPKNVLITKLKYDKDSLDIVIPSDDSNLHIISGDGKCSDIIHLGEQTLVQVLSANLVPDSHGLELLIPTSDGTLMCLHTNSNQSTYPISSSDGDWPAETRSHNGFTYWETKVGIKVLDSTKSLKHVTGMSFSLDFNIMDEHNAKSVWSKFHVKVYTGSVLLYNETFSSPGQHQRSIQCPQQPIKTMVHVHMTNQHGQVFQDAFPLSFNMSIQHDLKWLLLFPFLAMSCLLLLLHGYPSTNLLPMTQQSKQK